MKRETKTHRNDGWQRVETPQGEIWMPGEKPGSSIVGRLTDRREVNTESGAAVVFNLENEHGLWAIFARTELLRLLDLVWTYPGKGCEVRVTFTAWDKTKKGGFQMRRWAVDYRQPRV